MRTVSSNLSYLTEPAYPLCTTQSPAEGSGELRVPHAIPVVELRFHEPRGGEHQPTVLDSGPGRLQSRLQARPDRRSNVRTTAIQNASLSILRLAVASPRISLYFLGYGLTSNVGQPWLWVDPILLGIAAEQECKARCNLSLRL